jgi:hypothetical protein
MNEEIEIKMIQPPSYILETVLPPSALYKAAARDEEEGFFEVEVVSKPPPTLAMALLRRMANSTTINYAFLLALCLSVCCFVVFFLVSLSFKDIILGSVDFDVTLARVSSPLIHLANRHGIVI